MNTALIYIGIALFSVIVGPTIKWTLMKFNDIDAELQNKMNEQEVRQLIDDKYTPVKEDLVELKETIDKIFDHLLNNKD